MLAILLAATVLGASALPAVAQGDLPEPGRRARIAKELGLTEAQRTKLRDLGEAQLRRGIQERADLRIAELDLRRLVRADRPDRAAIDKQVDKIAGMRAQLAKERIATRLKMREVLTPEQRAKAREMRAMRDRPRGTRHRMRGGGEEL